MYSYVSFGVEYLVDSLVVKYVLMFFGDIRQVVKVFEQYMVYCIVLWLQQGSYGIIQDGIQ